MKFVLLILGIGLLGAGIYLYTKFLKKFVKDATRKGFTKDDYTKLGIFLGLIGASGLALQGSLTLFQNWSLSAGQGILSFLGILLFFVGLSACLGCFYIYYYKDNFNCKKPLFYVMCGLIAVTIIAFLLLAEGVGNLIKYPLVSGISIGGDSLLGTFNCVTRKGSGLNVAFYGILMISGVAVVYFICDHEFYKEFKKHGILDSVVLLVFPAGVIGARLGYVIGNWNGDLSTGEINGWDYWIKSGRWYQIWEGGLTILGGALVGIIAGVIFVKVRRKYVNVRWAMDVIVPAILVAQAIGRWGNFFNHEVYGQVTDMADWPLLPTFIKNQMATSWSNGVPTSGKMYVPLYLIESLINIIGFFVIKYAMGILVKKKILPIGSLCGGYLIWYGITRVIMEPLRDAEFNMGSKGLWSVLWSGLYIGLGILVIGVFFLMDYLKNKKQQQENK